MFYYPSEMTAVSIMVGLLPAVDALKARLVGIAFLGTSRVWVD